MSCPRALGTHDFALVVQFGGALPEARFIFAGLQQLYGVDRTGSLPSAGYSG